MLAFQGSAQPSPMLGDALNAKYRCLEVRRLGCDQTVALDIIRRRKSTPIHELERYMRCKDCSQLRCHPYKRSGRQQLLRSFGAAARSATELFVRMDIRFRRCRVDGAPRRRMHDAGVCFALVVRGRRPGPVKPIWPDCLDCKSVS